MTQANSMMGAMGALMNPQRLMDRMFKKADNVVWDMMTGKVGIRTRNGIVTLEYTPGDANATPPTDDTFQTVENPIDSLGMAVPAFAQQTAMDAVKVGDLILTSDERTGWVTKINPKSVSIIRPNGTHSSFTPPKTVVLDLGTGVMVVRSLFNMLPGGQQGVSGMMQQMMQLQMMAAMMGADGEDVMGDMMPFMLMSMGAGATSGVADQANPMLGLAGGGFQQMLPFMLMSKMMKNRGGSFGGFGSDAPFRK